MCGRYQLGMTWEELLAHYEAVRRDLDEGMFGGEVDRVAHAGTRTPLGFTLPWFNQAPGQPSPAVFAGPEGLEVRRARWGFPQTWLKSRGKDPWKERPLVNAKAEEARSKRTWSKPLAERRCLVPTTGFYEWVRRGKDRFPLWFRPPGGGILTLAGIWTVFDRGEEEALVCTSILTCGPNAVMAPVHDRMPVVLPRESWAAWLDPRSDGEEIDGLCLPAPDGALEAIEVSTALNGWKAAGPELLEADWSWEERPG